MNKFYIYSTKKDNIYVEEDKITDFALKDFRPLEMNFTGFYIDAKDPVEANEIYKAFPKIGEVMSCDEPISTIYVRKKYIENVTIYLSVRVAEQLLKINNDLKTLAETINAENVDKTYKVLKEAFINEFRNTTAS